MRGHQANSPNLGSPNGLAAGYFLAQHKRELGRKYIEKVTVFRADARGSMPNLLFWVANVPDTDSEGEDEDSEVEHSASVAGGQRRGVAAVDTELEPSLYGRSSEGDFIVHLGR
jgi:hypothetical protein